MRETARYLAVQTIGREIELVLCLPSKESWPAGSASGDPADLSLLDAFQRVEIVETGDIRVVAAAKVAGLRRAHSHYVAFIEEHAFPDPFWAEALLSRLEAGHVAAAGLMVNPNSSLAASWANFVVEYGPWAEPAASGLRKHLPGNNGAYRRDRLLRLGDRLEALLNAESILQWELCATGETLWLEARARVHHINITRFSPFWRVHYHYARMFAASRCTGWGLPRKCLYGIGFCAIPFLRLGRHWHDVFRCVPSGLRGFRFWAWLMFALTCSAVGEAAGYLFGIGGAREEVYRLEFHRRSLLASNDHVVLPPTGEN